MLTSQSHGARWWWASAYLHPPPRTQCCPKDV